jgi:hypothetical protein
MQSIYKAVSVLVAVNLMFAPTLALAGQGGNGGNGGGGNTDAAITIEKVTDVLGEHYPDEEEFDCEVHPLFSPLSVSGYGELGSNPPGHNNQYHVQIDWGDGVVEDEVSATFNNDANNSFTFSAGPHTYTSGSSLIKVRVYHQTPPGNDNQADDTDTLTVCIDLDGPNATPSAQDASVTTNEDVPVSGTLVATDDDNDTLTFAIATLPAHGDVVLNATTGEYTYTPDAGYFGSDSFTFTANDGVNTSAPATVSITVNEVVVTPPVVDVCPNIEDDQATIPEGMVLDGGNCVTPSNENTGGDNTGGGDTNTPPTTPANTNSGGGNGGGGGGYVMSGPLSIGYVNNGGGVVLGTSTEATSCGELITTYMREGKKNDTAEVTKLQNFLNSHLGLTIAANGVFGADTTAGVNAFQTKYMSEVLSPWTPFGHDGHTPTGYVYKTTKRMINKIACAALNIPQPQLP